jgi:hypothetical protein
MQVDPYDGWTTEGHTWWEVGTPQVSDNPKLRARKAPAEWRPNAPSSGRGSDDLRACGARNFVIIGRAGMDFYPDPAGHEDRNTHAFLLLPRRVLGQYRGGSVKLGGKADLVTCVSHDAIGRFA